MKKEEYEKLKQMIPRKDYTIIDHYIYFFGYQKFLGTPVEFVCRTPVDSDLSIEYCIKATDKTSYRWCTDSFNRIYSDILKKIGGKIYEENDSKSERICNPVQR